ncbi:ACT domain-containing protein [Planktotalea sp.]|nr:ACT domain-containing protein [Planktotalea sp.]
MSGKRDLQTLLRGISAQLVEGIYVLVTIPEGAMPQNLKPRMIFREA